MTQRQKGALYMILSALCFASMQVVVRLSREIPTMEQIFMRNSFVLIVSAIIILRKKGSLFGPAKYQPYLFGRSFFGFLGLITLFYASSHAAQGDVTILNKTSPIWVTILAVIFMKEKLPKIQIPALALSMVGAFIVFRPSFESNPFPLVVAFLSAVTSGVAYTFLSFFKGKVDGLTVMMHFSTFSAIASIPFMLKDFVVPSFKQAVLLLLIGVFGSLGQAFIVFRPSFESNPFPLVVAFLSAVTSGVAYTFLSFFKGKVDGLTVMMHFSTFSAIASIPFMLKDFVVPSFKQAVLLLLIGVFGSLGQAFITYAYRFAPASEISIYNYSGIIFSMILGFFILGEPVKFTSVIGGALVAAASVMVYVYNNRSNKKAGDETTK